MDVQARKEWKRFFLSLSLSLLTFDSPVNRKGSPNCWSADGVEPRSSERHEFVYLADGIFVRARFEVRLLLIPLIEDGTRRCDACVERTQSDTAPISSECRLIGHEPASPSLLVFARRSGSMIGASPSLFLHLVQPWRNRGLDSSVARGEWNNRIISSMIKIEQWNCGRKKKCGSRTVCLDRIAWTRSARDYDEHVIDSNPLWESDIKMLYTPSIFSLVGE